jgi:hypothetical protein
VTTTSDTTTTEAAPEPGRPVAKYVVVGIGVLVATAGLLATFLPRSRADISYRVIHVDLVRADQVTVTFQVEKAPLATAVCSVAAFNDKSGDQRRAWRLTGVEIGPAPDRRVTTHNVVVPTSSQATGASIAECRITRSH